MSNNIYDDKDLNYYIVMEQTTPEGSKATNISEHKVQDMNYVRFDTCLQTFSGRNRNRRLWLASQVKQMAESPEVVELIRRGSFVGEAGHPSPENGKLPLERIFHIEPLRCSHRIVSLEWKGANILHGTVETLAEGAGSPGFRFMRNIQQGIQPAFSLRSVVPQKKNMDGSIDVIGPGRMICYDRVYLPSHKEAYINLEIPVKEVTLNNNFESAMESYCGFMLNTSEKIQRIVDNMDPVTESISYDANKDLVTMNTDCGRIYIAPEAKFRNEIKDFMKNL